MTQRSFHWDGASIGDAEDLTVNAADGIGWRLANEDYQSPFVDIGLRMLYNGDENRGVLYGWLNELAVTGVATPVQVDTGGAIVYGMPYRNTAAVNVAVPAPTYDTRQDMIVLRRDWGAQTIRITRIEGVEGSGVPAITQSPAPSGTGVYDIPLASLSVTTGGVITVTDLREFTTFSTAFLDDAFGTTHFVNDTVGMSPRSTRTKSFFLGGGDLEPAVAGGYFYTSAYSTNQNDVSPPWGTGAANEAGWRTSGVPDRSGVYATFRLPDDYVGGALAPYIWWVANANMASPTFYFYHRWHAFKTGYSADFNSSYQYVYMNTAVNQHEVYRTAIGNPFQTSWYGWGPTGGFDLDTVVHMWLYYYNSAGTEDVNILGVEFEYTGYL
jgi:hypothetical protein